MLDNPTTLPAWVRNAAQHLVGHTKRYIFISTLSVYPNNSVPGADETDGLTPLPAGLDPHAATPDDARRNYGALKTQSERLPERAGEATVRVHRRRRDAGLRDRQRAQGIADDADRRDVCRLTAVGLSLMWISWVAVPASAVWLALGVWLARRQAAMAKVEHVDDIPLR